MVLPKITGSVVPPMRPMVPLIRLVFLFSCVLGGIRLYILTLPRGVSFEYDGPDKKKEFSDGSTLMQNIAATSFLLNSSTGKIVLPEKATTVVIDIGARDSEYLKTMEKLEDETISLILFDPLPDSATPLAKRVANYAMRNLIQGSHEDHFWLDKTKSRQVYLARAAMGEKEGIENFNIGGAAACSSLLPTSSENKFWCANVRDTIQVPVVTLSGLLPMIPDYIEQIHIKVDCEGADLLVLRGAGEHIHKVDTFLIECNADGLEKKFRDGECVESDAISYMETKDFEAVEIAGQGDLINIFFANLQYKGPLPEFLLYAYIKPFYKNLKNKKFNNQIAI